MRRVRHKTSHSNLPGIRIPAQARGLGGLGICPRWHGARQQDHGRELQPEASLRTGSYRGTEAAGVQNGRRPARVPSLVHIRTVMTALETFISQAAARSRERTEPADCVLLLAPLMLDLIEHAKTFLQPQHYRSETGSYARNLIYKASTK